MPHKRAHLVLPADLLAEVDALVGPRGRSAFLTEVIREAVQRRRLLQILSSPEPVLKDEDYQHHLALETTLLLSIILHWKRLIT